MPRPRRLAPSLALACLGVLLAAPFAGAAEAPVLAWTVAPDGAIASWWLDADGEVSRPGLWMASRGELVRVVAGGTRYAPCDCEAWMDSGFKGACGPSEVHKTDMALVQVGPGESRGAVSPRISPEEALELAEYEGGAQILGSAGPWLFVEGWAYVFGCGAAHPSAGQSFWLWNVEDGTRVEAFPGLLDVVEQERLTAGGLAEATRLLRAAEGADDEVAPSPALLRPDFGGGTLKLDVLWTTFACYACGDSEFGSYSLSVTLPTDVLPAKLAPWSKAPGRVTALLEAHPDLTLGGWGEAPPGRRKAFATAKFQLPAVSLQAEPGADLSNPVRAVRDYYEAVDDKRADDAFARFAFPDWDRAKWDQALWSGAGCAEVLDARLVFADDGEGKVAADLCVEDRAAGTIDRWTGAVRVSVAGGRWAMSGWELSKAGSCRPGCVP